MGLTAGIIAGAGALVGGGLSAYGASQAEAPSYRPRKYVMPNMNLYYQTLPSVFNMQSMVQGQYGGLNQQTAGDLLFGTPDQTRSLTWYHQGARTKNPRKMEYTVPGTPGLINQLAAAQPGISALSQAYREAQAEGMSSLLAKYGGDRSYFERSRPQLSKLQDYAMSELDLGGELNPSIRREVQQATRAGQSARGMGVGMSDAFEEAMSIGMAAEERKRNRERFAVAASDLAERYYADPMLPYLTPQSGDMGVAGSLLSQSYQQGSQAGQGPGFINPYGQFAGLTPPNNAMANTFGALGGGLMNLGGSLAGGYLAGRGGGAAGGVSLGGGGYTSPSAFANQPSYASQYGISY